MICFWPLGEEVFWRPEFFLKRVFNQIFCGQDEENISHHVTKNIILIMHLLTGKIGNLGLIYC